MEFSSLFNTFLSMKLDRKREKDQRSGLICAKLKPGSSHQGFLRSTWGFPLVKIPEIFTACIFFSTCISSGKLEIVKVLHKTRTRDKQAGSHLTISSANDPPSPRPNVYYR